MLLSIQSKTWSSFLSSLDEWAQNLDFATTTGLWLDLEGRKYNPLDFTRILDYVFDSPTNAILGNRVFSRNQKVRKSLRELIFEAGTETPNLISDF